MIRLARDRWLLGFVVLGFILRLAVALALGISKAPEPGTDQSEYDTYAWNMAQGRGYRGMSPDVVDQDHLTAYRPPGTSMAWALCYVVFGHRYAVIRIMDCVLGAASVALVYAIARRCGDKTIGLISAGVYSVWPMAVFHPSQLLSETLGTFFFLWFLLLSIELGLKPRWWKAIGAGLSLGLTILTRPNPLFMIPLMFVWALWQFRRDRSAMVKALAVPLLAVLTMVPWCVRNYSVFHTFIPVSTMGGSSLLQGNNRIVATDPVYYGSSIFDSRIPEYRDALHQPNDEVKRDEVAKQLAIQWLKDNKEKVPRMVLNKIVRGWTPFLTNRSPLHYRIGTLISWGPVLIVFLVGFVPVLLGFLRSGHPGWIFHLTILASLILTMITFGELRYRYTIEPVCIIIAVIFAAGIVRKASGNSVKSDFAAIGHS